MSDKEIDLHMLNKNIFNEQNESNKMNKNFHDNMVKEYFKNVGENIDSLNNQFSNMNLLNKDINEHSNFDNNIIEHNNLNYMNFNSL